MTLEKAYQILEVEPGAPFETVLQKKQKLLQRCDGEKAMDVEMAYDLLLMQVETLTRSCGVLGFFPDLFLYNGRSVCQH